MTTTTTKIAGVYKALFARVATIDTGSPDLPIQYPEPSNTFSPPANGRYLIATAFSNAPRWASLTSGKLDQGTLLVTVVWPKNQGVIQPNQIAGLVEAHFTPGLQLTADGATVKIGAGSYIASPIIEPDSVRVPVVIPWTA